MRLNFSIVYLFLTAGRVFTIDEKTERSYCHRVLFCTCASGVLISGCSLSAPVYKSERLSSNSVEELISHKTALHKSDSNSAQSPEGRSHSLLPATGIEPHSLNSELADWGLLETSNNSTSITDGAISNKTDNLKPSFHENFSAHFVSVPVDAVLQALAHEAGLALQLNQTLSATITLLSENTSLEDLLSQIAQQTPLFWRLDNARLSVWGDQAYTETYAVDYLNLDRKTRSRVGLATQVGTINSTTDGNLAGAANSSQTSLENYADHNFWGSLLVDLDGLVSESLRSSKEHYTINRDAGMVTLHASAPTHAAVQAYLNKLNRSAQRQVLIEATVVEVALSNRFQAGIDWQLVANEDSSVSAAQILSGSPTVTSANVSRLSAPSGLLSLVQNTKIGDLSATLNLLEQFGDVHILSKPRIIALNNQSSVLKVVDNRVYFTVNVERQRSESKDEIITETEIHTVPVGLVMNVTPYIDEDGGVMLNVRPTLSRILGFVDDPNPELAAADVKNSVPEIQVREMESMLRVNSGEIAIIGGLMQETEDNAHRQLPGLGNLPLIGHVFRQQNRQRKQTELLIVLKPTVLA